MFQRIRRGRFGRLLAVTTLVWMLGAYSVAPVAGAFTSNGGGLTALRTPKLSFPKFGKAGKSAKARKRSKRRRSSARAIERTLAQARRTMPRGSTPRSTVRPAPVTVDRYPVAPSKPKNEGDPTKGAPVVIDSIGAGSAPSDLTGTGASGAVDSGSSPGDATAYGARAHSSRKAKSARVTAKAAAADESTTPDGSNTSPSEATSEPSAPASSDGQPAAPAPSDDPAPAGASSGDPASTEIDGGKSPTIDSGADTPDSTAVVPDTVDTVELATNADPSDELLRVAGETLSDGTDLAKPESAVTPIDGQAALEGIDGVVVEDPYSAFEDVELSAVSIDAGLPPCGSAATGAGAATAGACATSSDPLLASARSGSGVQASPSLALAGASQPASSTLGTASARGPPPAGSVFIAAAQGGTVTSGDARLIFAPGSLPRDAYVLIRPSTQLISGLTGVVEAYDLFAYDVQTLDLIESFNVAPVLSIAYSGAEAPLAVYYVDPVSGPAPISSALGPGGRRVMADLHHFSTYALTSGVWTITLGGAPGERSPGPSARADRHELLDRRQRQKTTRTHRRKRHQHRIPTTPPTYQNDDLTIDFEDWVKTIPISFNGGNGINTLTIEGYFGEAHWTSSGTDGGSVVSTTCRR